MTNTNIGAYGVDYRLINTSYYTIQTLLTSDTMKVKGKIEILAGYHTNKSVKLLSIRVKKRCGENALATKVQYHRWKFPPPYQFSFIIFYNTKIICSVGMAHCFDDSIELHNFSANCLCFPAMRLVNCQAYICVYVLIFSKLVRLHKC